MVEFALILPVLMALVLGLVTGGAAYNRKLAMTSATREGTRFAATLPAATVDWASKVRTRTQELAAGELTGANTEVCVALIRKESAGETEVPGYSPACTLPASQKPATPLSLVAGQCVVKVWAQRTGDKLEALFFSTDLTLKASSVARFEESTC